MAKKLRRRRPGPVKPAEIFRYPGKVELAGFLKSNSKLFNLSELERVCEIPSSTLRQICATGREMRTDEYQKLKKVLLPNLCELVLLLQHYD